MSTGIAEIRRTLRTNPFCRASTGLTLSIIIDNKTHLLHIDDRLTADRYDTKVVEFVVLSFLQSAINKNRRPLMQTMNDMRTAVDVAWQQLPQATIN
ncbi:hypothetical protein TNCV_3440341 [Trichonephila clavipes]|uniref:Uncharacterized protein n=1 Tax=Trichonephila clavipes TaxID=2585209 RepID=A0A8X7BFN4_TRICX|nr:hypothetical protein TNCV_3440341 [Trichonephila clavipes]